MIISDSYFLLFGSLFKKFSLHAGLLCIASKTFCFLANPWRLVQRRRSQMEADERLSDAFASGKELYCASVTQAAPLPAINGFKHVRSLQRLATSIIDQF